VEFEGISDFDRRRLVRFIFESQRTERRRGLMEDSYGS
jgi:c-di-GMP-binding flagellar brake protein YcgR